jgi:beta-galactosidase
MPRGKSRLRSAPSGRLLLTVVLCAVACLPAAFAAREMPRESRLFDFDWRFFKGDSAGAEEPEFDDRQWRLLDLPHDWGIEDRPAATALPGGESPFDSEAPGGIDSGFTRGGVGWYRKSFTLPETWQGKVVTVQFDGVYMNADVWINGQHLGNHPYGYTSFQYDLSKHVRFGDQENVLAVQVSNQGRNSRWYSGSGIYRHVWLKVTAPIHIAQWSPTITTPKVEFDGATVSVRTTIDNETDQPADLSMGVSILDSRGATVAAGEASAHIGTQGSLVFDQTLRIDQPSLWSTESPYLYRAISELRQEEKVVDRVETPFGIRSLRFDPERGFFLNGERVLLKGGCLHDNNGALGAAAYDRAEQRRVELLKAAGFNALRGHNPPSPAFLEACDRLGMMVLEEAFDQWQVAKRPDDYHQYFDAWWERDLTEMIERDRNHPSVILWSIGNQIPERASERGARTARRLAAHVRSLDSTRPVTANVNRTALWPSLDPFFAALDVAGYSYGRAHYVEDHRRLPDRVILATETNPRDAFDYWMNVVDHDFVIGDFVWTAFDYMGEAGLGWLSYGHPASEVFPWTQAYSGDLDISGFRRPQSYYRDVLWNHDSKISAFVHRPEPSFEGENDSPWGWDDVTPSWTWPGHEGQPLQVDVYSACERVRLILNGKDLGVRPTSRETRFRATWQVPYEPGALTAVGYNRNSEVAHWSLHTAGEPRGLRLTADRPVIKADGQDLSYVTVEVIDADGLRHPEAQELIRFTVEGEGTLAAVGSSRPNSLESFQRPERTTFEGRCLVILKSGDKPGAIKLTARADGLSHSTIQITTVGAE